MADEKVMTPDEMAKRMRATAVMFVGDQEQLHMEGDKLLCLVLRQLGYQEAVEVYAKMPKWFA